MPDLIDEANEKAELFRTAALRQTLKASTSIPVGIGSCLFCGDDIDGHGRWCDVSCRDLFEAEQKRSRG